MDFELVLPCYNEMNSLEAIIRRAVEAASSNGYTPENFQLILVENGSTDRSLDELARLKRTELSSWFRIVEVAKNLGYGFGLYAGLRSTSSRYVGWSHADQQCDPSDAFRALAILKNQQNTKTLVKGVRSNRNWKDSAVSRVFEGIASLLLGHRFYEINAQPKVFRSALLTQIENPPRDFAFDLYVLYRAMKDGYTIKTVSVEFPPRIHGLSNWSTHFWGRAKHIRNMIFYIWNLSKEQGRLS